MALKTVGHGLTPRTEWDAKQKRLREEAERKKWQDDSDVQLNPDELERYNILRYCSKTFDDASRARKQFENFDTAWALFNGEIWGKSRAPWRSAITINKIRAFITFMQAIMTDNKPRVSVEPIVPGSEDAADLLRKLVDRDWDENDMQRVVSTWVLYGLIWGYAFIKVTYDPFANEGRGKHVAVAIPPYRIYANKSATCIEDAEYIIHIEEVTMGWIRRNFPYKAESVNKLLGVKIESKDGDVERGRDYVRESTPATTRISTAMNINGNIIAPQFPMAHPHTLDFDRDTVEVAEYWLRDDTLEEFQQQVVVNGEGQFEPVMQDGLPVMQVVGNKTVISEIDGQPVSIPVRAPKMQPKMQSALRHKYPNGRLVLIAAGKVLLRDIPNPYQVDGFPFAMWKDYDVGSFIGQGEPLTLRSCAMALNRLASQVFEILEKTGNPSWKVNKNAGVNLSSVKNKPGLVIPMDDVNAIQPLDKPPIPSQFFELYKLIADGMSEVSGINDSVKGSMPAANTAFATIDQLTEAGSAPIRLKVRNMESGLARYGKLRIQLIQQFDNGSRPLRYAKDDLDTVADGATDGEGNVVKPASAVSVQFKKYTNVDIQGQVEFSVIPVSSLSVSPAGLWNKWLGLYKERLIDEQWFHQKMRIEGWKTELPRMLKQKANDAAADAALKKASKVGGTKKASAPRQSQPPPSTLPTREQNAAIR